MKGGVDDTGHGWMIVVWALGLGAVIVSVWLPITLLVNAVFKAIGP
jgi:hypothetical protein